MKTLLTLAFICMMGVSTIAQEPHSILERASDDTVVQGTVVPYPLPEVIIENEPAEVAPCCPAVVYYCKPTLKQRVQAHVSCVKAKVAYKKCQRKAKVANFRQCVKARRCCK